MERAHARQRGEIEQAHDLGLLAGRDVDDERRDVGEDEVEAQPGATLGLGGRARATTLVAGAADVANDVALLQGAEGITDGDRDGGPVGRPAQDGAAQARIAGDGSVRIGVMSSRSAFISNS